MTISDSPCGPRSNLDLMNHVWTLSDYFCTNYAIVDLPSRTSDDKLVYVRQYKAEMGGMTTRRCNNWVCLLDDTLPFYDFGCMLPQKYTCVLCCNQPPSLKSAASEIVKKKKRFDNVTSCSTVEYYPDFDSDFEFGWATSHRPPYLQALTVRSPSPRLGIVTPPAEMLLTPCREWCQERSVQ